MSVRGTPETDRPSVLLIHSHDLGRHLGCYDRGVATPNIDALAEDGTLLENHFCTAPQCCPSRGSLHTGRHPHVNGLMGQITWGWDLPADETTMSEYLSDAGYSTHVFGVQHVRQDSTSIYDRVHAGTEPADAVADAFETDLSEMADDGPFFASVGFFEPHLSGGGEEAPYTYAYPDLDETTFEHTDPGDVEVPAYLPDRPQIREAVADLDDLVTHTLDDAVGRVLDRLDGAGLAEETLVIFTTDHGLALPRAKGSCYDPGIEVAFLARLPGVLDGGERYDELTSHVDVLPTLLDMLDLPIPEDLDGRSFRGLISEGSDGESYTPREFVRAETTWHERYVPMRAVRTENYKYVRNFWKQQRVHLPADIFGSRAGREVREEYYVNERAREELYDLREDPHEQDSRASSRGPLSPPGSGGMFDSPGTGADPDPEYTDAVQRLRRHVFDWMRATDDPLLDGPVSRPGSDVWEPDEVM